MDLNSVVIEGKVISKVTSSEELFFTEEEIKGKIEPLYNGKYCYFLMSVDNNLIVEIIIPGGGGPLNNTRLRVGGRLVYHNGHTGPVIEAILIEKGV